MTVALTLGGFIIGLAWFIPVVVLPNTAATSSATSSRGSSSVWSLLLPLVWIPIGATIHVIGWFARTYVIGANELVIDEGVLRRRRRVVPYGRLQQIDIDQNLVGQLFHLATLTIETAGSGQGKAKLGLLDVRLARGIRRYALQRRAEIQGTLRPPPTPHPHDAATSSLGTPPLPGGVPAAPWPAAAPCSPPEPTLLAPEVLLLRLDAGRLAIAGITHHVVVGAFPTLMLIGLAIAGVSVPANAQAPVVTVLLAGIGISQLVALGIAAIAVYQFVVGQYGYTLTEQGDDLHLRYGLFQVRNLTIPRRRVQHITVSDNPLRRAMGLVSVQLHSAAPTDRANQGQGQVQFEIPILARTELDGFLHALMGGDWRIPSLTPRPGAARRRAIVRRVGILVLLMVIPACSFLPGSLALASVALLGVPWGLWAHRRAGYAEAPEVAVLARGVFHHRVDLVPYSRLQSTLAVQNPMQRLSGLRTLHVNVAGRSADPRLSDMPADVALRFVRELPRRSTATLP